MRLLRRISAFFLVLLFVLCQLSMTALAAEENVLSLYKGTPEANMPFRAQNMFPGDYETNTYRVDISYIGSMVVYFHAEVRPGYEKLSEVLYCKVVYPETGEVVYDGLMKDMPKYDTRRHVYSPAAVTQPLYYEISAYLDTSVGNEYQNQSLVADFTWWVQTKPAYPEDDDDKVIISPSKDGDPDSHVPFKPDESDEPIEPDEPDEPIEPDEPDEPIEPDEPDEPIVPDEPDEPIVPDEPDEPIEPDEPDEPIEPDEPDEPIEPDEPDEPIEPDEPDEPIEPDEPEIPTGELVDPPKTGDDSNIWLWIGLMCGSALVIIVVVIVVRRKKDDDGDPQNRSKRLKGLWPGIISILILTACLVFTTYALVYDYVTVQENIFRTGQVKINLNNGNSVIQADEHIFEPGVTIVKDFFIENLSTADIYYRLYFDNVEGELADVLEVTLAHGDRVLFFGTPDELTKQNFEADLLMLNEKRWLTLTFHFPEHRGNDTKKRDLGFDLCAEAVQTQNNPDKTFE